MASELEDTVDMIRTYDMQDDFQERYEERLKWPESIRSSACRGCGNIFIDPKNTKTLLDGDGFSFVKNYYDPSCPLCYLLSGSIAPDTEETLKVHKFVSESPLISEFQIGNRLGADSFEIFGPTGELCQLLPILMFRNSYNYYLFFIVYRYLSYFMIAILT